MGDFVDVFDPFVMAAEIVGGLRFAYVSKMDKLGSLGLTNIPSQSS